ncbi:hypothetical protein [Actinomyces sp. 2119]|nr:hypothetical protein [Actinomyces sp. 2119]
MNTAHSTATEVFNDGLPAIIDSISAEIDNMPGGTADFAEATSIP